MINTHFNTDKYLTLLQEVLKLKISVFLFHAKLNVMSKILVLDDDTSNAEVIQLVLEDQDFEVRSIHKSALLDAAIKNFGPDLVVMDILLDNDDGRSLCDSLKRDVETMNIPILLITAMLESQAKAIASQADALMFKPFDYSKLTTTVRELIH